MTSLHQAAINGSLDLVRMLLECGSQVDVRDRDGNRPLHYACLHSKLDVAALLLRHNSDPNEPNLAQADTPLHLAVTSPAAACINLTNNHLTTSTNTSACSSATAVSTNARLVQLLLTQPNSHLSIQHANKSGDTPIEVACELGRTKLVEIMLTTAATSIADVRASASQALHRAVRNGHDDIVRLLLVHSVVDIDAPSRDGSGTALHEACRYGRYHTAKLLLECGASCQAKNAIGQIPLDVVIKQKVGLYY